MFGRSNSIKTTPPTTTPRPADNGSNGNNARSGTLQGVRVSQVQPAKSPAPPSVAKVNSSAIAHSASPTGKLQISVKQPTSEGTDETKLGRSGTTNHNALDPNSSASGRETPKTYPSFLRLLDDSPSWNEHRYPGIGNAKWISAGDALNQHAAGAGVSSGHGLSGSILASNQTASSGERKRKRDETGEIPQTSTAGVEQDARMKITSLLTDDKASIPGPLQSRATSVLGDLSTPPTPGGIISAADKVRNATVNSVRAQVIEAARSRPEKDIQLSLPHGSSVKYRHGTIKYNILKILSNIDSYKYYLNSMEVFDKIECSNNYRSIVEALNRMYKDKVINRTDFRYTVNGINNSYGYYL